MFKGHRISVVIPAFNEALLIESTLASVPKFVDSIWVIDDSSADATASLAEAWSSAVDSRVQVIRHKKNRGVGAAIMTGYHHALTEQPYAIAVMAGDGQMSPDNLCALLDPLTHESADYTKGDRLSHPRVQALMPTWRRWGNTILSTLTTWTLGLQVRDSQCGYTAITADAASTLLSLNIWPRYGYPNDILGWLNLYGLRVQEVLVKPVYGQEKSGIRFYHATIVIPWLLLRVVFRRLASFVRPRSQKSTPRVLVSLGP